MCKNLSSPRLTQTVIGYDRGVLLRHLDEEVEDLQAKNMKKYWKLEEVDRIAI